MPRTAPNNRLVQVLGPLLHLERWEHTGWGQSGPGCSSFAVICPPQSPGKRGMLSGWFPAAQLEAKGKILGTSLPPEMLVLEGWAPACPTQHNSTQCNSIQHNTTVLNFRAVPRVTPAACWKRSTKLALSPCVITGREGTPWKSP